MKAHKYIRDGMGLKLPIPYPVSKYFQESNFHLKKLWDGAGKICTPPY